MAEIVYKISLERREEYKKMSRDAQIAKRLALSGKGPKPIHQINIPRLKPEDLMPLIKSNGFNALSLFSGGGGLDLGFERAGFEHVASYDILDVCGETLKHNRPTWNVFAGSANGDVRKIDWRNYKGRVDIVHGGPPCQPFSIAGSQKGKYDQRNMWPEFINAVNVIKPKAFVAENVPGLTNGKFEHFIKKEILDQLLDYHVIFFKINSAMFGVPQNRERVIFVGFKNKTHATNFKVPAPTHKYDHYLSKKRNSKSHTLDTFFGSPPRMKTMGVREALGLEDIGYDALSPTLRSAFTGKRNTTSILNGTSGQKVWEKLQIWPNGVAGSRELAQIYVPKNKHRRLSVQDCAIIQGFPSSWKFRGAVYQILGQIGNSVAPPKAYAIAVNVSKAMKN